MQASQLAFKLQMMDDRDLSNPSSVPTFARETVTSSRDLLPVHEARAFQPNVPALDQRVVEIGTGGTYQEEHHDIPIDTPRFQALRDAAPLPANASTSALPDAYTGSITDSDLSSLPSGSNSARCSNSGRYPPPLLPPFLSRISFKTDSVLFPLARSGNLL